MRSILLVALLALASPLHAQPIPEHRRVCIQANTPFELGGSHDRQRVSWYRWTIVNAQTTAIVFQANKNITVWNSDGFGGGYVRLGNIPGLPPGRYWAYLGAYNDTAHDPGEPFELRVPGPDDPPCPVMFPWVRQGNRVQP